MAPPRNARPAMHEAQHGEFNIRWRRADLVAQLHIAPSVVSRQLRRLRLLGLIKRVTHTCRCYLTRLGRAAIAAACSLTRFEALLPWRIALDPA
jgi:DNA-binding HxlR family transcriptional regulator